MTDKADRASREPDTDRRRDTAAYIAELSAELAKMASAQDFEMLAYLLEIAELEAKTQAGLVPIALPN